MRFYSTNNPYNTVGIEQAVRKGLPDDKGLFLPTEIPQLSESFIAGINSFSLPEIGFEILKPYFHKAVPDTVLSQICNDAFSFPSPIHKLKENIYSLELYHGPTLAFKDFGARFMARLLGYFNTANQARNTILVATSGDTGSAVADGFYQIDNVEVVILYPYGKVSDLQERQMTSLGSNIHVIAIDGTFDDCQRLAKMAFTDKKLSDKFGLTSANSINIARLLPQMLYYFYAYAQLHINNKPIVFSVPSGNYGNLTAGVLAKKMGLPIKHFIAAANINDIVPQYLKTGNFQPKPSIETISNAMDVGDPSNFARLQTLFDHSLDDIKTEISGYSYTDEQTRETISKVYNEYEYVLDTHGAIGYRALDEYLDDSDATGVFLETAHPIKFKEEVEPIIGREIALPQQLKAVLMKDKRSYSCTSVYSNFIKLLAELLNK